MMLNQDAVTIREKDRKVSTAGGGIAKIDYQPPAPVSPLLRAKIKEAGRVIRPTGSEK